MPPNSRHAGPRNARFAAGWMGHGRSRSGSCLKSGASRLLERASLTFDINLAQHGENSAVMRDTSTASKVKKNGAYIVRRLISWCLVFVTESATPLHKRQNPATTRSNCHRSTTGIEKPS
jgi:hypothetical protein